MSLILGFDAGGTFTDSVVFNTETKKIISSGKALTTNFDLSQGIEKSLNVTLKDLPIRDKKNIKQIIVSSTLATNSLINSNGCRVGLILIGFDKSKVVKRILSGESPFLVKKTNKVSPSTITAEWRVVSSMT